MIRVVYLEQKEQTWSVGLLYQSPEAAADAADASAALRIADGRGQTLETALAAAEAALPQTADYRLCDYVLFPEQTEDAVLAAYENLVLERGCGRTAARLSCTEFDLEILLQACEKTEELPDKLLDKLKAGSGGNAPAVCTRGKHVASCALLARSTGRESDGFLAAGPSAPGAVRCSA